MGESSYLFNSILSASNTRQHTLQRFPGVRAPLHDGFRRRRSDDLPARIAAVLHEINWAETKGSGIRTMRRRADDAGLPLPDFASIDKKTSSRSRCFCTTY